MTIYGLVLPWTVPNAAIHTDPVCLQRVSLQKFSVNYTEKCYILCIYTCLVLSLLAVSKSFLLPPSIAQLIQTTRFTRPGCERFDLRPSKHLNSKNYTTPMNREVRWTRTTVVQRLGPRKMRQCVSISTWLRSVEVKPETRHNIFYFVQWQYHLAIVMYS